MDLSSVRSVRLPRERGELLLAPGEVFLAGGTWLYSEPQPEVAGLVDLTALGWPGLGVTADGLEIAATCTLAELLRLPPQPGWRAQPLFAQCVNSLVASFKIFSSATVGGNLCTALPAGALIGLTAALDANVQVWTADEGDYRLPVVDFVLGPQRTALAPGELLRSVHIGAAELQGRTAYRKIALTPLGRSGSLVIGRVDPGGETVFTVTAATPRPVQLRYPALPDAGTLRRDVATLGPWYDDPHGAPDWRRAMTLRLAEELRASA